jgi:hypothetical protein
MDACREWLAAARGHDIIAIAAQVRAAALLLPYACVCAGIHVCAGSLLVCAPASYDSPTRVCALLRSPVHDHH